MTVDDIRTELLALRDGEKRDVSTLARARHLVGLLQSKGISPRRLGLSLRQLGLNPRNVTGAGR